MTDSRATELIHIEAPHFVADVVDDDWGIIRAAPNLHWAVGQHVMELRRYCRRMGWKVRAATEPLAAR